MKVFTDIWKEAVEATNQLRKAKPSDMFEEEGKDFIDWEMETVAAFGNLATDHIRAKAELESRLSEIDSLVKVCYLLGKRGMYDKMKFKLE